MQKMLTRWWLAVVILMASGSAYSQEFSHSARLNNVPSSGFYQISITPELSSYLDVSLKDLRIVDAKGVQVAYIIKSGLPALNNQTFQPLPIVENSLKDTGQTHLVLQNNSSNNIAEMALVVRNAAVSRTAKISGSDDGKNWFAIAEDVYLDGGRLSDKDRFVLNITFPASSYKYLRIVIDNQKNDPLNIVEAGRYTSFDYKQVNTLLQNPSARHYQKDSSDGYSYIKVVQPASYHINNISLQLQSPKFFKRRLEVIGGNTYGDFIISSVSSPSYFLPMFNSREFTIKIYNGDNAPLKITAVQTAQEARNIIAHLEKGISYSLLLGNSNASAPAYDLQDFKDSIPTLVPSVGHEALVKNTSTAVEKDDSHTSLWLIIVGVLALLSFFTWNLTRELKHKK